MCPHQSDDIATLLHVPKGTLLFKNLKMMATYIKCLDEKTSTNGLHVAVDKSLYVDNYFSTALTYTGGQWVGAVGFTDDDQLWYAFPDTVYLCREYI